MMNLLKAVTCLYSQNGCLTEVPTSSNYTIKMQLLISTKSSFYIYVEVNVVRVQDCILFVYFIEVLMSVQTTKTSTSEKPSESEPEQQSGHLPYTFVVVATVCTCMFLVVLVVFSIVRHTTLSKRQRNSSIERAPMRIRIRSHSPRHRTRHHRHHRSSRGHVVMHGAVRQTVSGFFEGNVAPPPYSAVLDDTESVRAGDPPPPYRPPSHIGIIV